MTPIPGKLWMSVGHDFGENHSILSVGGVGKDPRNQSAKPPYFREEDTRAQRRENTADLERHCAWSLWPQTL